MQNPRPAVRAVGMNRAQDMVTNKACHTHHSLLLCQKPFVGLERVTLRVQIVAPAETSAALGLGEDCDSGAWSVGRCWLDAESRGGIGGIYTTRWLCAAYGQ